MDEETLSGLDQAAVDRLRDLAALGLWRAEAVRVNLDEPFRLASGNRSPIYINCRTVISNPAFLDLFVAAAGALLEQAGAELEGLAGGETAGIPYAAVLARALGKRLHYVRKQAKGHGIAARVEGHLRPGDRTALVEDLITDGGSKIGFLEALRAAGAVVEHAVVLFDRGQGGTELLAGHGVTLHAVTDRAAALEVARQTGLLRAAETAAVDAYFADPAGWHRDRGFEYS